MSSVTFICTDRNFTFHVGMASDDPVKKNVAGGLAVATCCHHACNWADYCGKSWLQGQGFSSAEFEAMKHWSGWAHTLGKKEERSLSSSKTEEGSNVDAEIVNRQHGTPDNIGADDCEDDDKVAHACVPGPGSGGIGWLRDYRPQLDEHEMSEVGKMIKRLLDHGRVEYLRANGFHAHQSRYCDPSLSPECFIILAKDEVVVTEGMKDRI